MLMSKGCQGWADFVLSIKDYLLYWYTNTEMFFVSDFSEYMTLHVSTPCRDTWNKHRKQICSDY